MSQKIINTGVADKGNGDPIRTAFTKVNENFTELYNSVGADVQIPSQIGNASKYLTTNGTALSWATVAGGTATGDANVWVQDFETETGAPADVPGIATSVEYLANGDIVTLFNHSCDPIGGPQTRYNSLARFSPDGTKLWSIRFNGDQYTDGWGLAVDNINGFIYAAGKKDNDSSYEVATLTKLTQANGSIIWSKQYDVGHDNTNAVVDVGTDGNPVVVGYAYNGSDNQVVTTKINAITGAVVWSKALDGQNDEQAYGMAIGPNNEIVAVGNMAQLSDSNTDDQMLVVKYNSAGVIQWQIAVAVEPGFDCGGADADIDSAGNIYVCGNFSYNNNNNTNNSLIIIKFDSTGVKQWSRKVVGNCEDYASSIVVGPDNCLYISAVTGNNSQQDFTMVIAKYTVDGLVAWQRLLDNTAAWTFAGSFFFGQGGSGSTLAVRAGYVAVVGGFADIFTNGTSHAVLAQFDSAGTVFSVDDYDFKLATFSGLLNGSASDITVVNAGKTASNYSVEFETSDFDPDIDLTSDLVGTLHSSVSGSSSSSIDNGEYSVRVGRDGSTTFPRLSVDLHNGGVQSAQTLQFGNPNKQAVITGPTPAPGANAQRIIIQGQRGTSGGEGGDVYVWGGDSDVNGGDIKIYAGDADSNVSGNGGYINIDAGRGFNNGGGLSLSAGNSTGGAGSYGGSVNIRAGQGYGGYPGAIDLQTFTAVGGGYTWSFGPNGKLTLPAGGDIVDNTGTSVLGGGGSSLGNFTFSEDTMTDLNGITMTTNRGSVQFGGVIEGPGQSSHFHISASNILATDLFFGDDYNYVKLPKNPEYGVEIGAHHTTTGGPMYTWRFDPDGVLTIPGEINSAAGTGDVVIEANDGVARTWTFGGDGTLTFPDNRILQVTDSSLGVQTSKSLTTDNIIANGSEFNTDQNVDGFGVINGWSQRNAQQIEMNLFVAPAPIWALLTGLALGRTVIVTYSTGSGNQTFTSVLSQLFTATGQYDQFSRQRYSGRIDGTLPVGQTGIVSINFPEYSTQNSVWTFGTDGSLSLPNTISNAYSQIYTINGGFQTVFETFSTTDGGKGTGQKLTLDLDAGEVKIQSWPGYEWTFSIDGRLTLPAGGYIDETAAPLGTAKSLDLHPGNPVYPNQYLRIYPTAGENDANHLHLTSGNPATTDIYLGDDEQYVKLANNGKVVIATNTNHWTFGIDGDLTLPTVIAGTGATVKSQSAITVQAGQYYLYDIVSQSGGWSLGYGNVAAFYTATSPNLGALVSPGDIAHSGSISATVASVVSSPSNGGQWEISIGAPEDAAYSGGTGAWSFSKAGNAGGTWTFGADGKLLLPGGNAQIVVENDYGVRIGTGNLNTAPSGHIRIGGADHAFEIFGGPPGYSWKFDATGRTTFPTATVPAHSYGATGDKQGMVAFDSTYIYYCTADFDGTQYPAQTAISGANGVDNGYLVPNSWQLPQVGWIIYYNNQTTTINQVNNGGNPGYYTIFVDTRLSIPADGNFFYGPPATTDIWKRTAHGTGTW